MTVLHTGSTKAFVAGWESIFVGKKSARPRAAQAVASKGKKSAAKKANSAGKPARRRAK